MRRLHSARPRLFSFLIYANAEGMVKVKKEGISYAMISFINSSNQKKPDAIPALVHNVIYLKFGNNASLK